MAIVAWLTKIGLERYVSAFEAAEIDVDTLQLVTEDDLKEIGLPLGPRKKVLAERAQLPASDEPEEAASTPERRQLTVMFADLVDSTAMSVRTDPELLSDLLQTYKATAAGEVTRHTGVVAKYMGDGVLAYFGWPQAREDAAECAVRCALSILEAVKSVKGPDGAPIACRIGVATGLVVVGGVTGSGWAREDTIAGEVLNLAARIEALAEPGAVAIAESTHRLVANAFECEDLGERALKGFDQPVRAWRPLRETTRAQRFATALAPRTPLIGRDQELAMMVARWEKASLGEGRAVLVLGEAGMGKSRLAQALQSHIAEAPHHVVNWQCSAFHSGKALYPVIEHLITAADILASDTPAQRLGKLADLLKTEAEALPEALPLFADLLAIPPEAGYAPLELTPIQRRTATIAALADWLGLVAQAKPLLLQLEDAHWSDATTLDLMARIIGSIGRSPLLAVVTSRPGFAPPWTGTAQAGLIGLDRLSDEESKLLVQGLAAGSSAIAETIDKVISNSDGNPLFLEELSRAVFDKRMAVGQVVPDSLQSSLMARLDQLGEAKKVAQTCAVLGRRFATPLLSRVIGLEPDALDRQLTALVADNILYPLGRAKDGRYEFKHALVRDAAYGSLLLSRRRELHASCAAALERDFPDVVATEPELLAHHFAEASLPEPASRYAEKAGDRAGSNVSYVEAIAGYRTALAQLAKTAPGVERDRRELALLLKLGPAQVIIHGPQEAEVRATYARAEALSRSLEDGARLFQSVWGLWLNANIGRNLDEAAERAEQLIELGDRSGDEAQNLEALHCRWSSALFRGEYAKASADGARGSTLYVTERHHRLHVDFGGHDPGVCACAVRSSALSAVGSFAESRLSTAQAIALAETLDHPHSICHALMNAAVGAAIARDEGAVRLHGGELNRLATKYNFPPVRTLASFLLRWADADADVAGGMEAMRSEFPNAVARVPFPVLFAGLLADQLVRRGETEAAIDVTEQALGFLRPAGVGLFLPEIHRLRGVASIQNGDHAAGVEHLKQARAVAERQGSALFETRALVSELRFVGGAGSRVELQEDLRKASAAIDAGPDWRDRREAEAILAQ